jgi:hypothetical protein
VPYIRNYEKKIMLGTPDTWSMSRLSKRATKPAYYISYLFGKPGKHFQNVFCKAFKRLVHPSIHLYLPGKTAG